MQDAEVQLEVVRDHHTACYPFSPIDDHHLDAKVSVSAIVDSIEAMAYFVQGPVKSRRGI
jgi:hypothetical protein